MPYVVQEVKQLKEQLKTALNNTAVTVQCQLADTTEELILEVTALRAKVKEMGEEAAIQEEVIRNRVREEYDDLVNNLFSAGYELKQQFDQFR